MLPCQCVQHIFCGQADWRANLKVESFFPYDAFFQLSVEKLAKLGIICELVMTNNQVISSLSTHRNAKDHRLQ